MDPQQGTSFRRNLFGGPWRIPNNLDIGFEDARQIEKLILRVGGDGSPHTATLGGERHLHFNASAICKFVDMHVVDKAQVDNVDGNFGVVACLERLILSKVHKLLRFNGPQSASARARSILQDKALLQSL